MPDVIGQGISVVLEKYREGDLSSAEAVRNIKEIKCLGCERAKMPEHEIRHGLSQINKDIVHYLHSCGYTKDYEEAMRKIIVDICKLGDSLSI